MNTKGNSVLVVKLGTIELPDSVLAVARKLGEAVVIDVANIEAHRNGYDYAVLFGDPARLDAIDAVLALKPARPFFIWWTCEELRGADLQRLTQRLRLNVLISANGQKGVSLTTPEGGFIQFGTEIEKLCEFLERRRAVSWFRTESDVSLVSPVPLEAREKADELLRFAHSTRLLCNLNGNVAVRLQPTRAGATSFLVSPRGVNKAALLAADLLKVAVDIENRVVRCPDISRKSSIDTGVLGTLFSRYPELAFVLHFHPTEAIVLPVANTDFPFPCGTLEEAQELGRAIDRSERDSFLIEMVHHGFLLGGTEAFRGRLLAEWAETQDEYADHLREIDEFDKLAESVQNPIFVGTKLLGVLNMHRDGWGSIYVRKAERGRKLGAQLASIAANRGLTIGAHDLCRVAAFYRRLGWQESGRDGRMTYFAPPPVARHG
ncbi:MAG: class II aldolase/adducin family protein [Bdellovibrionota bacterium]